jgi:2-polyprenyl-3-methyl-5-hydroxy-6-metoxy-1,4-benzoquinol methylase
MFGYEIQLKKKNNKSGFGDIKYFNDGKSPLRQNSRSINDRFYADKKALHVYFGKERLDFYSFIIKQIEAEGLDLQDKSLLDAGCGSGHLLWFIRKKYTNCRCDGFDFSKHAIQYAKTLLSEGNFFVHDIYTRVPHTYDVVVCTEVLEHLEYPAKAILNLLNSLKQKGVCLITIPNGRFDTLEEHINFWSPESWKIFLSELLDKEKYTIHIKSTARKNIVTFICKNLVKA